MKQKKIGEIQRKKDEKLQGENPDNDDGKNKKLTNMIWWGKAS